MSFEFLSPDQADPEGGFAPVPQSTIERQLVKAGATIEERDGWRIATRFGHPGDDLEACRDTVGVAECSFLGKLELQASPTATASIVAAASGGQTLTLGRAERAGDGTWWCPITPSRVLAICEPGQTAAVRGRLDEAAGATSDLSSVIELTTQYGAFRVAGPLARETFARLSALDTRPGEFPEQAFAPISVGRAPSFVLREGGDRFLHLFGSGYVQYMWTATIDAAEHLGGRPVGIDVLTHVAGEPASEAGEALHA